MRKIITALTIMSFICAFAFSAEKKVQNPTTPETPTTPATPATPEKAKVKISRITGEITDISASESTLTVKKEDGTTVKVKATTPNTKEAISKLKLGDKVIVSYRETKTGENVILKIRKPEEKPKKGKKK